MIEPVVVNLTDAEEFSLSYQQVNTKNVDDFNVEPTSVELELIKISDEFSDDAIIKYFNKNAKIKPQEYFKTLKKDTEEKLIRPFIEKRLAAMLDIMAKNDIQPYYLPKKKDAIIEKQIFINDHPLEMIFNFTKNGSETKYFITMHDNGHLISPMNRQAFIVTNKPCRMFLGNFIYYFTDEIDGKKIEPFFTKPHILVPASYQEKYYETFVLNAIRNYKVIAKGFQILEQKQEGSPLLKFESQLNKEPTLVLYYKYFSKVFLANDKSRSAVIFKKNNEDFVFTKILRDVTWEKIIRQALLDMGLVNREGCVYTLPFEDIDGVDNSSREQKFKLLLWLNDNSERLSSMGFEIVQEESSTKYYTGSVELDMSIKQTNDWFDIYGNVKFGDIIIPFTNLRDHIINGYREFKLPNGEIAIIPEEWFTKYSSLLQFSNSETGQLQIQKHHFSIIEKLEETVQGSQLKKLDKLTDPTALKKYQLPAELDGILRPYQEEGFNWLCHLEENNLNGCLADDMGLGKTLQTLSLLLYSSMKAKPKPKKPISEDQIMLFDDSHIMPPHTSLIVMPLSLIHNWEFEIKKFTPSMKVHLHVGIKRLQSSESFKKYDFVLTTYGVVRNDLDMLKKFPFHYIICDESQVIKNPNSKIFKAIRSVNARHKLTITGTPIENSLSDLWAQMSFLNEGLLGNLNFFKDYFVTPIEKQRDIIRQKELQELIRPFMLRRSKQSVAKDLPSLSTKIYYCEMGDEQKSIYEEHKSAIRNVILDNLEKHGNDKSRFVILNGLMQLRLLANHPRLVDENYIDESGKFDEIIRSIDKLVKEKHKVLIFSSFVKHLQILKQWLDAHKYKYSILTGETSQKRRKEVIEEFQNQDDRNLFLISIKAGGVGLNLTQADYVFILDPWWNPAVESQAINRTHRIGQKNNVFAYKFITRHSIEEKILKLQEEKSIIASELVNENNPFKNFTNEEIKELFD